ncbi:MAG: cupredoxin domain-containing protein [Actinomycetota bacterium]|nr:cupredoxin domain-containing protein [Actinomycetota bacterium]
MRFRRLVLGGLLPLALLAGCSSSGSSGKAAVGTGGPGDAARAGRTVEVQIDANAYKPPTIDVAKGETVTFNVKNNDATVHEFVLGDSKVQDAYEKTMAGMSKTPMEGMPDTQNIIEVKAGQSKPITWTFPNGATTVIYGSHQPGDYSKGLKGTINVK